MEIQIDNLIAESITEGETVTGRSYVSFHEVCSALPLAIPSYSFSNGGNTVHLDFNFSEDFSDAISMKTSEILFQKNESGYDVDKIIHDFTFGCLTQTTDVKLSTYLSGYQVPKGKEHLLRKTPDYLVQVEGVLCLVEFGTTASTSKDVMRKYYDVKMDTYSSTMEDLKPFVPINYQVFVIIVGPSGVVTNMSLPDYCLEQLVYRYKVARALDDDMITSGHKVRLLDREKNESTKHLVARLNQMKLEGMKEFSESNYKRLMSREPDIIEVKRAIAHAWSKSVDYVSDRNWFKQRQEGTRITNSLLAISKQVSEHIEESMGLAPDGFNTSDKAVVNFPWVVLESGVPSLRIKDSDFYHRSIPEDNADAVLRLWIQAQNKVRENDDFIDNCEIYDAYDDLSQDPATLSSFMDGLPTLGSKPSETRNLYSRVQLEIPKSDAIELAKIGFEGKKYVKENEPSVKEYRKEKQKPFGFLSTEVADIESMWQSDPTWMLDSSKTKNNGKGTHETELLIRKAHLIHGENELTDQYDSFLSDLTKTPYFQWTSLISDVAFEICLALRQNCKPNCVIIKKLMFWKCYLIIKPTKMSSKIFFSLLWFNDDLIMKAPDIGQVFKRFNSNSQVSWTDFVSLDQCKIENWALAESRTLAMIPYWLEFHGLPPFTLDFKTPAEKEKMRSAMQMMQLYTWIELADKSEIEQEASLFRYMFMKSLTAKPLVPEPEVVIANFKKQVRSRLTIWIQKNLIEYAVYVANDNIKIHQEDLEVNGHSLSTASTKRMLWKGLINPYTKSLLSNPGEAVNIMYIGYVQNKNLQPEANVFFKMLEKILILEDDLTPEVESRIGVTNKPLGSKTKHEYNIDLLQSATNYVKNTYLPKLHGPSALNQTIEDIIAKIANTNIEEVFTTLKATSNFGEEFFEISEKEYHRLKVIEKVQVYVHGEGIKVSDILFTCFDEVDKNGYMRIDIFQKNQHGGIREIYVLGFAERVVQWFIETITRGLCHLFPGETMTHPENKKRLPDEYFKNLKIKNNNQPMITVATSADASKWSQNMYSHKFAVMLCWLLPDYLHPFIWRALSFWTNKYIMIPKPVVERMHEGDNEKYYNKYMNGLYGAYKGWEGKRWAEEGKAYIKVKTGMMQGILHYTSSLFHTIMNVYTEMQTMKSFHKITGLYLEPLIMQSSDDSCEILSCLMPEKQVERMKVLYCLSVCQIFKAELGEEVAIRNSDKKTAFHLEFVFEFNSAYHFGPSRYESDLKMLSSSLICTDRENIVDRHMEQYTQLTNFINAGGSIYSANYIQMAQALFNYRLMGRSVTNRFRLLSAAYRLLPDPNLGFFLLDNPLFTGLCGYKYNLWKVIMNTMVGQNYKYYLNAALMPTEKKKKPDLLSTKNGVLVKRAILNFGNRQKLLRVIERMKLPEDWQDLLDKDPSLMFRPADNEEEFRILCSLKMHSPGVQESLSTGNITSRVMASSAYISLATVMRSLGEWQSKKELDMNQYGLEDRYNLVQLISHELKILSDESGSLEESEMVFMFPYHEEYRALEAKLAVCNYTIPKRKIIDYRRVITDVRVFDRDNVTSLPPDQIMGAIWFEDNDKVPKPRYPMKYLKKCFRDLKRVITWLDEDLQKTLDDGPFEHINGLVPWLSQFHQKDKVVTIIGSPIVCRRGSSSILAVIRQNFHKTFQLENIQDEGAVVTSSDYNALKQAILMAMSYPGESPERRLTQILCSPVSRELKYNPASVKSRFNTLCIMRDAISGFIEPLDILQRISESRIGIVGAYVQPQKFCTEKFCYYGPGTWTGKFYDKKVRLEIDSDTPEETDSSPTSYLKRIFIQDIYPTEDLLFCLKTWCKENNVSDTIPEHRLGEVNDETRSIAIRYARRAGLVGGIKARFYRGKLTDNPRGIPIIITADIVDHLGDITEFKLEVPLNRETGIPRGVIKLMGKVRGGLQYGRNPWLTLTRYVVNHRDYLGCCDINMGIMMQEANRTWITNSPMTLDTASKTITYAMNNNCPSTMREHVREVLRETFSKRGLKLGKRRDQMPLMKESYKQYVEDVINLGGSPERKVLRIPDVSDLVKEEKDREPVERFDKGVKWADEVIDDAMRKLDDDNMMVDLPTTPEASDMEDISDDSLMNIISTQPKKVVAPEPEVNSESCVSGDEEDEENYEEEEDDDSIDWGSDDEADEKIKEIMAEMSNSKDLYAEVLEEIDAHEAIALEMDMDLLQMDNEMEMYTAEQLHRDLEMINSVEYQVTSSIADTNVRNSIVKKEHNWFKTWVSDLCSRYYYDLTKLFHRRVMTQNIKQSGFLKVMEFLYPDVEFKEEEVVLAIAETEEDYDPFEEKDDSE